MFDPNGHIDLMDILWTVSFGVQYEKIWGRWDAHNFRYFVFEE